MRSIEHFRDELLAKDWPDDLRLAKMARLSHSENIERFAARLRSNGTLFGVWVAHEHAFRYPDVQFDVLGNVKPEVADLLRLLPGEDEDRGGWRRAFWLYSPHALLDGRTPAEVFQSQPRLVVDVARREFAADGDSSW
ncbi:hypothetical protein C0Z18_31395 [Trinickia dabaoshanensis]|uniref:Antitoxin Xre/MbcA/ParS-like toxin-binding domain-containing protein n=1 Tax=Trinickia dabaoshanensis TaxID=564714 RepID=A0A2N7VBC6_9BURK|nr:hypothetical protein [Trinickia dabaoshanensis]PMS14461.1 hypothetical protein C0Z18_31395 [Trinickia dabaoshanensis]